LELATDGFPATVAVVEPTGSETHVVLRLGEHEIVALFRERHKFEPGQVVHLRPRLEQVHLFDSVSGQRI
jgi:multiple sugar transport system ATP-binding protein